ncbi:phage tail protein [Cohnella zeiphila]|uniref:Phage tail protein n=1 Tax=Cohnella zeiphila TaxID=2761120 RepID=A0A7X0VXB3_9BACL|nr:tail fiber protein [Cohnella zeiphila]MBB6733851.1 phage tail protein [Cohnella zeiphila]
MAEPYVGEIRMFAGNFAPQGWLLCQGQQLPIQEYQVLFSLLGTTFGGDGQTTFGLPDLRGRVPVHPSYAMVQGEMGGSETVTLTAAELPSHTHAAAASKMEGDAKSPVGAVWAPSSLLSYGDIDKGVPEPMNAASLTVSGGGQPHSNMMPSLTISFIIATAGAFPSQG